MKSDALTLAALALMGAPVVGCQSTSPDERFATRAEGPVVSAPVGASAFNAGGHAVVRCSVNVTGDLRNCKVLSESPAGQGRGAAALKALRLLRVRPATGEIVTGPRISKAADPAQAEKAASGGRSAEASGAIPVKAKVDDQAPSGSTKAGTGENSMMPSTNTSPAPN